MSFRWLFLLGFTLFTPTTWAAGPLPLFLKQTTGCFQVTYHYVEQGPEVLPPYREKLTEWIKASEEAGAVRVQHYALIDGVARKHWASVWKEILPDAWEQTILGPAGDVRYRCVSPIKKGKGDITQRTCSAVHAPKPRRDKDRLDYETLNRWHLVTITPDRWVDTQRNEKTSSAGGMVSQEFGWNDYARVDETNCLTLIDAFGR